MPSPRGDKVILLFVAGVLNTILPVGLSTLPVVWYFNVRSTGCAGAVYNIVPLTVAVALPLAPAIGDVLALITTVGATDHV